MHHLEEAKTKNLKAEYNLYNELDTQLNEFLKQNEAEIVKLCQEKHNLGMSSEMTFRSPLRTWNYFIRQKDSCVVVRSITVTALNLNINMDENMYGEKELI